MKAGDVEGLVFELIVIAGEFFGLEDFLGQMKAGPGSPATKVGMIAGHAGSEMLEMAHGISDEKVVFPLNEKPNQRGVGRGVVRNHGRFVQLKDGLGRFLLKPERL